MPARTQEEPHFGHLPHEYSTVYLRACSTVYGVLQLSSVLGQVYVPQFIASTSVSHCVSQIKRIINAVSTSPDAFHSN